MGFVAACRVRWQCLSDLRYYKLSGIADDFFDPSRDVIANLGVPAVITVRASWGDTGSIPVRYFGNEVFWFGCGLGVLVMLEVVFIALVFIA